MQYLADLIYRLESGRRGYNAYNQGSVSNGGDETLTTLTLQEVMERQALPRGNARRLFAVGAAQCIPSTLQAACSALRLDLELPFSEALQDHITAWYLLHRKQPAIKAYITGGGDLHEALNALASEWASFPDPDTGETKYPKGGNKALVGLPEVEEALITARSTYLQHQGKGHEVAWELAVFGTTKQEPWNEAAPTETVPMHGNTFTWAVLGENGNPTTLTQETLPLNAVFINIQQFGQQRVPVFKVPVEATTARITPKPTPFLDPTSVTNWAALGLILTSLGQAAGLPVPDMQALQGNETLGVLGGLLTLGLRRLATKYLTK